MAKKVKNNKRRGAQKADSVLRHRRFVKVSHHRHTAKHLPFKYTSYAILFFIIIFSALLLFFIREQVVNAGPPQSVNGDINLSAVMPGPPPTDAATITQPANNQQFSKSIITVTGDCTSGLIVEVYRNDTFAGSVMCESSGGYTLSITLVAGQNNLVAKIRDSINQYGPDSNTVVVFYDVPSPQEIIEQADGIRPTQAQAEEIQNTYVNDPLTLYTKPLHSGYIHTKLKIPYEIKGGKSPYAVSIDWGDGSESIESVNEAGQYMVRHSYDKPGNFRVTFAATDQINSQVLIQTLIIVGGEEEVIYINNLCESNPTHPSCPVQNQIAQYIEAAWVAFLGASILAGSFWLGEQVVYTKMIAPSTKTKR